MRRKRDLAVVPPEWAWVERQYPGAYAAWMRDVGKPTDRTTCLGETGPKPIRAICATHEWRYRFNNGRWVAMVVRAVDGRFIEEQVSEPANAIK